MAGEQLPTVAGPGGKEPPMIGHQAVMRCVRVAACRTQCSGEQCRPTKRFLLKLRGVGQLELMGESRSEEGGACTSTKDQFINQFTASDI
jgi:hypothetical protein